MQKSGKGSLRGLQSHNQREKDCNTNPDIDMSKKEENYDLVNPIPISYFQKINQRISELNLKKAVRKDAVLMCNFIVTSDSAFFKNLSEEEQKQFFEDSKIFFANRYGENNLIHATVHMDETTPHMHLGLVPVTDDGRLSAKSIFNRTELKSLQTDFAKDVGEKYGLIRGEENSTREHLTEQKFKEVTLQKKIEVLENKLEDISLDLNKKQEEIVKTNREITNLHNKKQSLRKSMKGLQAEYKTKQKYIRTCDKSSEVSMMIPSYAEVKERGILNKEKVIIVPLEKWEERHVSANEKDVLKKATEYLENLIEAFKNTTSAEYLRSLQEEIKELEKEIGLIRKENTNLQRQNNVLDKESDKLMDKINKVVTSLPDEIADKFIEQWNKEKSKTHQKDFGQER